MADFKLKHPHGVYKVVPQKNIYMNNRNITNELALEFLAFDPNRIALFSEYPADWKAQLGLEESNEEVEQAEPVQETEEEQECSPCQKRKELREMKMTELKEAYPEVKVAFGMKKEDLIQAIIQTLYPDE